MTVAACILLPLLLALVHPWLPPSPWLPPATAMVNLLLAFSLPWTGGPLGGWLLADGLGVYLAGLAAFAWLIASAAGPLDGVDVSPGAVALVVGCIQVAALSDGAGLMVMGAGAAAIAAIWLWRPALLPVAAAGLGMAVFGLALLASGAAAVGFAMLLVGLGCACTALPVWSAVGGVALPRSVAILAGPLGGVWLTAMLRMRDGLGEAAGRPMLVMGLAGLALAVWALRRPNPVLAPAVVAVFGGTLVGFALGGDPARASLLHLGLGCLALTAAALPGLPGTVGLVSLAGLPPFGLFASLWAVMAAAGVQSLGLAMLLGLAWFAVAVLAWRSLPAPLPHSRASRLGWAGIALTLGGAWAMPGAVTAWLHGIAVAAR